MRTRQKLVTTSNYDAALGVTSEVDVPKEIFVEGSYPGSNNCFHIFSDTSTWYGNYPDGGYFRSLNRPARVVWASNSAGLDFLRSQLTVALSSLNWSKLPTSTEFGLIQFFAELDQTLLLFTKRFWKELNYGSFTWGVLPFVSELQAILETISNFGKDQSRFSYEDQQNIPINAEYLHNVGHLIRFDGSAIVRRTGVGDISFVNDANRFLDTLGFHPDFATAWDLVPLSFIVDWVLPVGDFLESFRQGGWVKAMRFDGWVTWKFSGSVTETIRDGNPAFAPGQYASNKIEVFERWKASDVITVNTNPVDTVELNMPSISELFGYWYLLTSRDFKRKHGFGRL